MTSEGTGGDVELVRSAHTCATASSAAPSRPCLGEMGPSPRANALTNGSKGAAGGVIGLGPARTAGPLGSGARRTRPVRAAGDEFADRDSRGCARWDTERNALSTVLKGYCNVPVVPSRLRDPTPVDRAPALAARL